MILKKNFQDIKKMPDKINVQFNTNPCGRLITRVLEVDKSYEWNIILFDAFYHTLSAFLHI